MSNLLEGAAKHAWAGADLFSTGTREVSAVLDLSSARVSGGDCQPVWLLKVGRSDGDPAGEEPANPTSRLPLCVHGWPPSRCVWSKSQWNSHHGCVSEPRAERDVVVSRALVQGCKVPTIMNGRLAGGESSRGKAGRDLGPALFHHLILIPLARAVQTIYYPCA